MKEYRTRNRILLSGKRQHPNNEVMVLRESRLYILALAYSDLNIDDIHKMKQKHDIRTLKGETGE